MKNLQVEKTSIDGCLLVKIQIFEDERGWLGENYNEDTFKKHGLPTSFRQDNVSLSYPGVIRGLHIQKVGRTRQGKLIRCGSGHLRDVCLDLRPESPTFKKIFTVDLVPGSSSLYIPDGCAHGFSVLGDEPALVLYKLTEIYEPADQLGVNCLDPELSIDWGVSGQSILNEKDKKLPSLAEYLKAHGPK